MSSRSLLERLQSYRRGQMSLAGLVLVGCLALGMPAGALAAEAPVIGSTVAYGITQSDATLEASIDPGALPEGVYYQFQVVANTSEYLPELACPERGVPLSKPDGCGGPDSGPTTPGALPIGYIEKEPASHYVRLDLDAAGMTLKPGTTYHYRVLAARRMQSEDTFNWEGPPAVGPDQTFTTLTPGTPPAIESESASNITSTDATLEAKIKPEGLATTYEFYLEAPSCSSYGPGACEASDGIPIAKGSIPAGSAAQTVSVDVAGTGHSLTPDTIEGYRVVASNSAGTTEGPFFNTFTTLPGPPPVIDSESVSHLTPTDATLEAQLNTEGLEASYEFQLTYTRCRECMSPTYNIPLPSGLLLGSFQTQSVSLDLNSAGVTLKPGFYEYSLSATSTGGTTVVHGGSFEPPEEVVQPLNNTLPPGLHSTAGPPQTAGQGTVTLATTNPLGTVTPSLKMMALRNAQKLAKAVKACKRKPKWQRASCVKAAHKKYGKAATKAK